MDQVLEPGVYSYFVLVIEAPLVVLTHNNGSENLYKILRETSATE